jgi:hypothetical protein
MPAPRRTDAECRRVLKAFEDAKGNKKEAAKSLGLPENTYRSAYVDAVGRFGESDETKDPIEERRSRSRENLLRSRLDEVERQAAHDRTIRESIFKLAERPIEPPSWNPRPSKGTKHRESIVLFLSDIHMGEEIKLENMGGRNSYNMKIAVRRLERYFQNVVKLGTEHWTGPPPDSIYLVLGGDMISGEIHEELAKTNDLLSIPAVQILAEALAAGIMLLRESFPALPINVISVPGNHGRTTRKPESKDFALNSYDTLVAWLLEWWATTKGIKNVTFSAPRSGDAVVVIHGWTHLFTHGDRIGSRGGAGFVGPAATVSRGMQKLIQDYSAEGIILHTIVIGHFHCDLELEQGFCNGSVPGPSEFSRSFRMRSHPATQLMFTVHPHYRIARRWRIQIGDKSEGSIYGGGAV